ncbi:hypothetical protein [Dactylosporangium sp. CA-092794]|uniref:hypothetical protein n=1 Tax=Dactylosporangium sp. CA-092794 TaxID=3239929 RepID=UPI003D8B5BC5
MIKDADLRSMTPEERAHLARRLAVLAPPVTDRPPAVAERARRRFVIVIGVASALLIPWVAVLAATLPPRYLAGHWRATWVGFDMAVAATLGLTAWAALRRRQIMILLSVVSGTLLVADAWFDLMTAAGPDRWVSLATALIVELPLAGWLYFASHHLVLLSMRRVLILSGQSPDVSLWRLSLFGVPPHRSRPAVHQH